MYTEVNTDWVYKNLRKDLREHLDWDGIEALLAYYDELEAEDGEPMKFDIALFFSWDKGGLEEIYLEHHSKEDFERLRDSCKSYDPELEDDEGELDEDEFRETLEDELRSEGRLVTIDEDEDLYLFSND